MGAKLGVWCSLGLIGGLIVGASAEAHGMRIDAETRPAEVVGVVRYSNGKPVAGATVTLMTAAGVTLSGRVADTSGGFEFSEVAAGPHRLRADDGLGHRALLSLDVPLALGVPPAPLNRTTAEALPEGAVVSGIEDPVQVWSSTPHWRWRDLVAGLGYLVGLAGIAAWWRSRRTTSG